MDWNWFLRRKKKRIKNFVLKFKQQNLADRAVVHLFTRNLCKLNAVFLINSP